MFARAIVWALVIGGCLFGPLSAPAVADKTLRIAMSTSDIPIANGMPNNGFEGLRFLGYPIFEGLVLWDLARTDVNAPLRPGLAERWEQDPADPKRWIFHLRPGVKFHDGTNFDADAVAWNLDRFYTSDSPQFDRIGSGTVRARAALLESWRKIDERTIAVSSTRPISYFPYMLVNVLFTSPKSFDAGGRNWAQVSSLPAAGTGPFKILKVSPRESVELGRNDAYWDTGNRAKLDRVVLLPIPEANARTAALRSGQVDWIEAPPTDALPSLKAAGLNVVTHPYPHVWPWFLNMSAQGSPLKDVRVRQALNYCIDRKAVVSLLSGTAAPAIGYFAAGDPQFGSPSNLYDFDPAKGKKLLEEAGFTKDKPLSFKVMIAPSGAGQMQPVPMNEALQQTMKEACGIDVQLDVVDFNTLWVASRLVPDSPGLKGSMAVNMTASSADNSIMTRMFSGDAAYFSPNGFNFAHYNDEQFNRSIRELEIATDPAHILAATRAAHERLVDNPPWLFVVHDLDPRAMSSKVAGYVPARSWYFDLSRIDLR